MDAAASATTFATTSGVTGPGTPANGSAGASAIAANSWLAAATAKLGTAASRRFAYAPASA